MMHFSSTKKLSIAVSLILVIAVAAYVGSIYLIKQKVKEVAMFETRASEKTTLSEGNRILRETLEASKPETDRLISRVVNKSQTVSFIDSVESLARSSNLSALVESVEEKKIPDGVEGYQNLSINIKTQGSWEATYRFLTLLESLPYKMSIESADIKNEMFEKSSWNSLITLSVLQHK